MTDTIERLEQQLNDFDFDVRHQALLALIEAWRRGEVIMPAPQDIANLHCHTFFSFNGYGYSPTALAWLGRKLGLRAMGSVDFDVLDGVVEFLEACDLVGLRSVAGLETRVFIPQFATREINSPGEPGIFYLMGVGYVHSEAPAGAAAETLAQMRQGAERRNRRMVERLNAHLAPVTVDYDGDVLPLTPKGNATERHMLVAYDEKARQIIGDGPQLVAFWADRLGLPEAPVAELVLDANDLRNTIRSKLMKKGGVGYMAPGPDTFPDAAVVNAMTIACGAIPCATWLDGMSAGEQAEEELLTLLIEQGVGLLNIIPDRNWNISDPAEREIKVANLRQIMALARALDLPVIVGTEMNKYGQKLVDEFEAEALAPFRGEFMKGTYFAYGHTVLARTLGCGYQSAWATSHLPSRGERNTFYTACGRAITPGLGMLTTLTAEMTPAEMLKRLGAR